VHGRVSEDRDVVRKLANKLRRGLAFLCYASRELGSVVLHILETRLADVE
jgi:hypothetical protein